MTTVQSIIESAFSRSSASDAGKLAVDGELIAFLNREYQALFAMLSIRAGDGMAAKQSVVFAGVPAAFTLPTDIVDIVRIEPAAGTRSYLIPIAEKDRTIHMAPAMFRIGNAIQTRGNLGDPASGDSYTLYYKDAPATLSVLASTLDARFPVRYENILVLKCAIYLSVKDEGRNPQDVQSLRAELQDYMETLGLLTKSTNTARESAHPAQNAPGSAN